MTWLDVMAGSIGAMLWAAMTLWARRLWLESHKFIPGCILFVFLAFGLLIFSSRLMYWAMEQHKPIVSVLQ
ncbi:MAG: hypothetical protein A4E20_04815 [Nitrospira sp. SG-bin2]|nr:MAG: hypothetical protein A4E20_04815 [Nitrospira sp. SG-bin2]